MVVLALVGFFFLLWFELYSYTAHSYHKGSLAPSSLSLYDLFCIRGSHGLGDTIVPCKQLASHRIKVMKFNEEYLHVCIALQATLLYCIEPVPLEEISKQSSMQVWRLLYTKLVGPRGKKFESIRPFWSFFPFTSKWEVHMSFPRELCTCRGCNKEGSMETIHLWGMH